MKSKAQMERKLRRLKSEKQQEMEEIQTQMFADWSSVDYISGEIAILNWILGETK